MALQLAASRFLYHSRITETVAAVSDFFLSLNDRKGKRKTSLLNGWFTWNCHTYWLNSLDSGFYLFEGKIAKTFFVCTVWAKNLGHRLMTIVVKS